MRGCAREREGIGRALRALALALALALPVTLAAAAGPRSVAVRGTEEAGFTRLAFAFDAPVKVTARAAGTVLVIGFSEPARIRAERLAEEIAGTVGVVRHDPDGTGLRLALARATRVNVLEAGERVFVDLLPESWSGLPPGLPPDVVEALARRAREAEERARKLAPPAAPPETLPLRVAQLPTLLRLVFPVKAGVEVAYEAKDGTVRLAIQRPYRLDESEARGRLLPTVRSLAAEPTPEALRVTLKLAPDVEPRGFREEDGFVLDLASKTAKAAAPSAAPQGETPASAAGPAAKPSAAEATRQADAVAVKPAGPKALEPKAADPKASEPKAPEPKAPEPKTASDSRTTAEPKVSGAGPPTGPVRAVAQTLTGGGLRLTFPFASPPPAALFERGGVATLVFETAQPVLLPAGALPAGALAPLGEPQRIGAFQVVRLALDGPRLLQLGTDGAGGWVLGADADGLPAREPLVPARGVDAAGRSAVTVPLKRPGSVLWLDPERVAVVPAAGPPAGVPKPGRFVEFELLPTAHGVAVLAAADDLQVRPGIDGVSVGRGGGLAVSSAPGAEPEAAVAPPDLVIGRERWIEDGRGDVGARLRERALAAAEAAPSGRGEARVELARTQLAAGLDEEAALTLRLAAADDPVVERRRGVAVLRGVAALRMRRDADALKFLGGEVAADPEARLWRALADARAGRYGPALGAFRRAAALLDAYPDDLQAELRAAASRAAIEEGDLAYAEAELGRAESRALEPLAVQGLALLRARLAEAAGRPEAALDAYRRLEADAERPVAAEAALRAVDLGLASGKLAPEEAIERLETVNLWWRGDGTEARLLARLGRLYAGAGRWREAFTIARRANRRYPDDPATRGLYDETAGLFESLFLTGKGASLSRVETLALFFDFKEFAPIGRRGDEIVRRLADRLVELDLLDAAGELLEHQVDKRLTGAARATVAARLATIRLMDGRPDRALAALHSSRLPDLPAEIRRARNLLEARALSDMTRTDLALDVIADERGPEIERLRADILWGARRWREAGEAHEAIVGERWRAREPLTEADRADVIRAAIAYALAEEPIGLDRLRAKFAARMAESADARTFAFLCQPNVVATRAFKDLARSAASAETLTSFLAEYRKRYPEAAAAARPASPQPPG